MQIAVFGLAAFSTLWTPGLPPTNVQSYPVYPWCAEYAHRTGNVLLVDGPGGGTNCYFATLAQCEQAVRGIGGVCVQNPFYRQGVPAADRPAQKKYRHGSRS